MRPAARLLSLLMIAGGALLGMAAILADQLGYSSNGMGATQWSMLLLGLLSVAAGIAFSRPRGRRWLAIRWQYLGSAQAMSGAIVLAVFFGLISGWGQTAVQFVRRNLRHEIVGMGLDYPWLIPLASLGMFLPSWPSLPSSACCCLSGTSTGWPWRSSRPGSQRRQRVSLPDADTPQIRQRALLWVGRRCSECPPLRRMSVHILHAETSSSVRARPSGLLRSGFGVVKRSPSA
jgi:hypothetical protein